MSVTLAAFNALDGFSDPERADQIIDHIYKMDADDRPDAMVFPEAYAERETGLLNNVIDRFEDMKYEVDHGPYDDKDGRQDRHGLLAVVRANRLRRDNDFTPIQLAGRLAFRMTVNDLLTGTPITAVGAHFDDRTANRRLWMTAQYLHEVSESAPSVLFGDLNEARPDGLLSTALRAARPITDRLPVRDPGVPPAEGTPAWKAKLERVGSLTTRLTAMTEGLALERLEQKGYRNALSERPTMLKVAGKLAIPVAALDRVMVNDQVSVQHASAKTLRGKNGRPLSDHRMVTARLQAKPTR